MRFLKKLSFLLAKYTALFIVVLALLTFYQPHLFTWVKGDTQVFIISIIMLSMGMTLGKQDYQVLAQRPLDIFIGMLVQYTVMPFVAIAIAKSFDLSPALTLGLVLVGSCPGGVASNIMTFLCKGDVAFSVGMTTVSTLIAPVMTPLLLNYLVGQSIEMNGWAMFKFMLLVTVLPVAVGSILNIAFHRKQWFQDIKALMPGVAVINFAFIVGGVVAIYGDYFLQSGLVILLCIIVHNLIGYALGYFAGKGVGMSLAKKKTLSLEVGVQNAGLATGLSMKFFPTIPESAVVCAVACVWHSVAGTVYANFLLWLDKYRRTKQ